MHRSQALIDLQRRLQCIELLLFPVDIKEDELVQTERLHVVVEKDFLAEVQQLRVRLACRKQ